MPTINDKEFGEITVRRNVRASAIRISVGPNGSLRASVPAYAPLFLLKRFIGSSRTQLRSMLDQQKQSFEITDGAKIGKSHKILIRDSQSTSVTRRGQYIIVKLDPDTSLEDTHVQQQVRDTIKTVLRVEAKSYLPHRLAHLAKEHGYSYSKVRFSHASSRWGSCSSTGTISLNIALMKLPHELIDYVLVHELAHTKQMDHSQAFWQLVEAADPHYKAHRRALKNNSPTI